MTDSAPSSVIFGMSGTRLTGDEIRLFTTLNPYGFILFARNCESPQQIKRLVRELRNVTGRERLPILIDQEGGRVARLKPPYWETYQPAGTFATLATRELDKARKAVYLNAQLIAHDLRTLGITVDCAPIADMPVKGSHFIIGDRAFGSKPDQVIELARAMAQGLMDGGIIPVLKHIPGHGRANSDSHQELPVVRESLDMLRATDFVPFKALADLPMAMTAHVLYTAIDPDRMATLSTRAINIIRHEIGFEGLLMSDDLSMKALRGDFTTRARDALAAGCDVVLHCNGNIGEMRAIAKGVAPLGGIALARAEKAMNSVGVAKDFDVDKTRATLNGILAA